MSDPQAANTATNTGPEIANEPTGSQGKKVFKKDKKKIKAGEEQPEGLGTQVTTVQDTQPAEIDSQTTLDPASQLDNHQSEAIVDEVAQSRTATALQTTPEEPTNAIDHVDASGTEIESTDEHSRAQAEQVLPIKGDLTELAAEPPVDNLNQSGLKLDATDLLVELQEELVPLLRDPKLNKLGILQYLDRQTQILKEIDPNRFLFEAGVRELDRKLYAMDMFIGGVSSIIDCDVVVSFSEFLIHTTKITELFNRFIE